MIHSSNHLLYVQIVKEIYFRTILSNLRDMIYSRVYMKLV